MNKIAICGVTPEYAQPKCPPSSFVEICETDKLVIPVTDPDMDEIICVKVAIHVRRFNIVCTTVGKKLVIYANKEIELIAKSECIKFVSRYCIPTCAFLMLDEQDDDRKEVKAIIEDIDVMQTGKRGVVVSSLILFYPEYNFAGNPKGYDNAICCDISLNQFLPLQQKHRMGI